MGQTPSCMPAADPMRKRVATGSPSSDGPTTQSMSRSRSASSHPPSPTQRRSPSSFTFSAAASPPSPLSLPRKALTVDPQLSTQTPSGLSPPSAAAQPRFASSASASASASSASSSVRSLLSRLSAQRDRRQWLASTPTGADAARFPHFCPVCYRHFAAILVTSCCAHSICQQCAAGYLRAKLPSHPPLSSLPAAAMPCPCPACNQHGGVRFIPLAGSQQPRSYVDSPRTTALLSRQQRQSQRRQQRQVDQSALGAAA